MKHILTEKQFRRLIDKSVEKVLNEREFDENN